ncbi:MAG: FAD-dependent oxidoreductase [Ruminococcus sp.]|nr:FAD-dependent oxidoreductase [Ruminococcus sp.]
MLYDTVIIGSGPAGLSAAVYAGRASMKFIVIEKVFMGTGQIAESECVDNYLGLPATNGFDLGEKFRAHAESMGTEFVEGDVSEIVPEDGNYRIKLSDGESYLTKTVIYAAGASHRRLGVKGEEEFSGRGVSYCAVCDGAFYKGKIVAIVGGGDTALGEAVFLSKLAEKVYLIHRRDSFRANKSLQEKVSQIANIIPVMSAVPTEIYGDKKVGGIELSHEGNTERLTVDGVFVAVGTVPNSEPLRGVAELSPEGYVMAGEDCVTSAKGIFAAGDVRTKPLRQVITAAADGACCVYEAEKYLEG